MKLGLNVSLSAEEKKREGKIKNKVSVIHIAAGLLLAFVYLWLFHLEL